MNEIKRYKDGTFLEYDEGKFDKWCVYYTNEKGYKSAPKDIDYFKDLYDFSQKYSYKRLYDDYVKIYDNTSKEINKDILEYIEQISEQYELGDRKTIDKMFTILYMGMIAEENKVNTKLGKRIKRLGIHALLIENKSIQESATFMNGKKWYELDKLCKERGF